MTTPRDRTRGERGIAVVMTALCLIPLMIFAAFGVDLASWYARVSFLQKSADAASLAGTVWMPDLTEAISVACDSLEKNGIVGNGTSPSCAGGGGFTVTVEKGSTSTALRVIVEDPDADRYFSQVFRGQQALRRSAEAEYNLPIPLGSPLNYFGGDATRTVPTPSFSYSLDWPTNGASSSRLPAVPQVGETAQGFSCNVGSLSAQNYGRWSNATTYTTGFTGSTRCLYSVLFQSASGTTTSVPPDYTRRAPTNTPCNVFHGTSTNGRWTNATTFDPNGRYTSGTAASGNRQCSWGNATSGDVPPWYNTGNAPGSAPSNRPCRVGYPTTLGWWGPGSSGGWSATIPSSVTTGGTATQANGNRLCRWQSAITTTNTTPPNPINSSRSPGFWAMIEGPGSVSTNGDAFMPRCYINDNCATADNVSYELDTDPDRGYWYVVKMPSVALGSVDINVFDASYNNGVSAAGVLAGDRTLGSDTTLFQTEFRVYQQNNLLDFTDHDPVTTTAADQVEGSCHWTMGNQTTFRGSWNRLCTITAPTPGSYYLVNVRTTGTNGHGINGYAIEAESNDHVGTQPALYAYENMGMQNNNRCTPVGSCTPPPATFYLAEVGPQYAGKTLVVDLWDPGDVSSGDAAMYPKRPSTNPGTPGAVVDVPAADCEYSASPTPNAVQSTSDGGGTGEIVAAGHASDFPGECGVVTATASARRLNGEWLTIRITIPTNYTCTLGINPVTTGGSCWWGIEYIFSEASQDVTTWQARIEGNPVHLTT